MYSLFTCHFIETLLTVISYHILATRGSLHWYTVWLSQTLKPDTLVVAIIVAHLFIQSSNRLR